MMADTVDEGWTSQQAVAASTQLLWTFYLCLCFDTCLSCKLYYCPVLLLHNAHCASACAAQSSVAFWEQQASPRMGFSEKLGQAKNGRLLLLLSKPSHCLHLPINGFSSQAVGVQMLNMVIWWHQSEKKKTFSLVCGLTMLTLRRGQLSWRKNPSWIPTKGWHRKSRTNCTRANLFPSAQPMCVPTRGWWGWSYAPGLDTTNPNLKNNILDSFRTAVKSWLRCFYCLPLLAIAALTKLAAHLLRAITATIAGYYYNATIVLQLLQSIY